MKSIFALAALSLVYGSPLPNENAPEAKSDYIVILKPSAQPNNLRKRWTNTILTGLETYQEYNANEFTGFAASLTAGQVKALKRESDVCFSAETPLARN